MNDINAIDIDVLASALDPRYKVWIPWWWKISEIKTELEDQISQLTCDGEANSSSLSSASQIIPPPAKKKVLDILFGQEERNPSVLTDEVELYFLKIPFPEILIHFSGGRQALYDIHVQVNWWSHYLQFQQRLQLVRDYFQWLGWLLQDSAAT